METRPQSDAGQVIVAGFASAAPDPELLEATRLGELGGIILFKRNIEGPAEAAGLVRTYVEAAPADGPIWVCVDQEGGRVARFGPPVLKLPPMRRLGDIDDPELTRRAARVLGRQLAALGFDVDFAPVLDVDTNPANPVIGDRSFGRDPEAVARHGIAFAAGLREGGVLGCGKHFPGHGDTDLDSHLALPRLGHGRERLEAIELAPFRAAGGQIPMVMTAHVVFEAIEPGIPATFSREAIEGLLRPWLGPDGVVVSDDLEMKAVADHYGVGDAACRAIAAGCDLLLICSKPELVREAKAALAARAERDSAFAARLREAAERGLRLRRSCPPRPLGGAALQSALDDPEARAVEDEIARRLSG